jgi:putative transcriptional regulator
MPTNLQAVIEKQRAIYETLGSPLLYQLARIHGLGIREFARVFQISKNTADAILNHRRYPSLELAFRIARYFDLKVDELFGWMVDDNGQRRPLVLQINGKVYRVSERDNPLELIEINAREGPRWDRKLKKAYLKIYEGEIKTFEGEIDIRRMLIHGLKEELGKHGASDGD